MPESASQAPQIAHPALQAVLNEFADVFISSTSLPHSSRLTSYLVDTLRVALIKARTANENAHAHRKLHAYRRRRSRLLPPYVDPNIAVPSRPAPKRVLPAIVTDNPITDRYEVEAIRAIRHRGRGRQFLVKWAGTTENENTW
eukprot:jgi/Hompol1/4177/HPOL_006965-RA